MKNNTYRLPETTTQESLQERWSTVLKYGDYILLAGHYFMGQGKNSYFGAIYTFTTEDKTSEGQVKQEKISTEMYADNGSAIAWCIQNAH